MENRDTQWRVAYVRHLGDKQRGLGPRDNFKFFDDLGSLKADYCAFLEFKEYGDEHWTVLARIFVGTLYVNHIGLRQDGVLEALEYILVDEKGEKLSKSSLKKGIICFYLQ